MRSLFVSIVLIIPFFIKAQISGFIHIDQFGYFTNENKVAVISDPINGFNSADSYSPGAALQLRDFKNNNIVFSASPVQWNGGSTHVQSGDRGWWFDFSAYNSEGVYYIFDPTTGHKSAPFNINANPYKNILNVALRMFYYNRCNFTKAAPYAETAWLDDMNFMNPGQHGNSRYAYNRNNGSLEKDMSGGWFDAGDYNKYVTFAHDPVHHLLSTYEEFPSIYNDNMNWPESGDGISDILNEIKWELDWLLKMIDPDGSVHIKIGSISHAQNNSAPPSVNIDSTFYGHTCTSASIAMASMLAHASKVFAAQPGMGVYATELKNKAILCWDYFLPFFNANNLEFNCDDGLVKSGDADWDWAQQRDIAVEAASYLFDITGDMDYDGFFKNNYNSTEPMTTGFWSPYKTELVDALLNYTTIAAADVAVKNNIINSAFTAVTNNWNKFFAFSADDLYRAESPDWIYHWGSNQPKAGIGVLCMIFKKYNLVPAANNDLHEKALEQLHYFHGVNPLGLVYLSNMYQYGGDRCANEIYHSWFNDFTDWDHAIDSMYGPAPGFVVGGPNQDFSVGGISPPAGQPEQKSYLDFNNGWPDNSWEITEPAIYYQAMYIRLLANFVNNNLINSPANMEAVNNWIEIFPDPSGGYYFLKGILQNYTIEILDNNNNLYQTVEALGSEAVIDVNDLPAGLFFVKVEHKNNGEVSVVKIIKDN